MAYATQTRTADFSLFNVKALVKSLTERAARYSVYRETLAELNQLDDAELSDLGLSRTQARAIAHKAAYGA